MLSAGRQTAGETRLVSQLLTTEPTVWKSSDLIFTSVVSKSEAQILCSFGAHREQEVVSILGFIPIHSTQSLDNLRVPKKCAIKKIQGKRVSFEIIFLGLRINVMY